MSTLSPTDYRALADQIRHWGAALGFQQIGIADTDLTLAEQHLHQWLERGMHGDMAYMASHGLKRSRPQELVPGTLRIISVRMDYLPPDDDGEAVLADPLLAFISRYALGRDYHKLMRHRLQKLASQIEAEVGPFGYRAFVDSAPVLERALAEKAGLGWTGKHSNIVNRRAGSWFFLGELYTTLPLPTDQAEADHCGRCTACIDICPTEAIVAPYQVDARRCISYLTIELDGPIPEPLRPLMGNRIYGCDDCLMVCPWNRFASPTAEADFSPRNGLDNATLCSLFAWDEATFLKRLEGSPIRRIGHERWLRNIAIALGNALTTPAILTALESRRDDPSELVREHVLWALERHQP
ncbi:tRNA epoxyqueuosine(34) reductase QueG [Sedimenticola sp.]|uniref:tRNA epoxyqueuosine(34) reductase QueG n=1 Tax=Sedimenticola sp. TaxID=1940285 RepID=UPI003D0C6482